MFTKIPYSVKDVAQGLRTQLRMNSTELPSFHMAEAAMWQAIKEALTVERQLPEMPWLNFGVLLSNELRKSPLRVIRDLSEPSVCSFHVDIAEDDFLRFFGRHEQWQSLHKDMRNNYYRARFSSIYWCSVRDYAVKSKMDCVSIFRIPASIAEVISESSTSQIIDFCHGFAHLQQFGLNCPIEDCLRIARLGQTNPVNEKRMLALKLLKSNHCSLRGIDI